MNLLRIEQTYPKIGIETNSSKIQLQSKPSKLYIQQENTKVEIEKELPKVLIDQSACFSTAGLKSTAEIVQETAQDAYQQALAYTAQKAQEGDLLANIRNKGNAIAEIARSNSFHQHEFNIDLIPKVRPKIDVTGYIRINFKKGEASTDVEEGYTNISFTKPQINIYLLQKPKLNIEYIGNNIDTKI